MSRVAFPGQPKVPPPSYPPPPVPGHPKGPPPPVPHPPIKSPQYSIQKKPTTPVPGPPKPSDSLNKGPPPGPSPPPPLHRPIANRKTIAPAPSPVCPKKPVVGSVSLSTLPGYDRKPAPAMVINNPSTLHICEGLGNKLVLNSRDRCSSHNLNNSPGERKLTPLGCKPPSKCPPPGMKPKLSQPSLQ